MGLFIEVECDQAQLDQATIRELSLTCPVDIFGVHGDQLVIDTENEDECTLCELCLELAPPGALVIRKKYLNQQLVSRGKAARATV